MDKLVNLVIALSTSVVRELRKVATITATQIATSLIHVVVTLRESRDAAAGQAAAEESKKTGRGGGKVAGERAAAFKRQVQEASAAMQELLQYVDSIFQSVFMNRFRDIDSEIRLAVVSGIGRWMQLLPANFLTATYLKYAAWAVSDKEPQVRLEAASALCALYYEPANASQLREFTDRFAGRFVELMDDKEDPVAVAGVKLVTQLVRLGHLPDTIGSRVVRLMSDASPGLRAAAADLAAGMLKDLGKEALGAVAKRPQQQQRGNSGRGGRGRSKSRASNVGNAHSEVDCELAGVLRVLRMLAAEEADLSGAVGEAEAPPLAEGVVSLVVGSLLQRTPALRNWQLMVDWLKAETAVEIFGDSAASDLLCCLLAGIRSAAGAGQPPARGFGRDKQAAARAKVRQEATLALRDDLQPLLLKFQSVPAEAAVAVALVPELKLEVFSLRQEERKLTSLLNAVKNVFFMHADVACMNACADALVACARSGPDTTRDAARSVLAETVTATVAELSKATGSLESAGQDALSKATADYRSTDGKEENPALFAARAATCRAAALVAVHPSGFSEDEEGTDALGRILELAAAGVDLPTPIVTATATASLLVLVFNLSQLDEDTPDVAALGELAVAQATFASQLESILTEREEQNDLESCKGIAAVQADLMTVFSAQNLPENHQEVAYRPSDTAVTMFWKGMEAAMLSPDTPELGGGGVNSDNNILSATGAYGSSSLPSAAQVVARLCACACVPQYRQLTAQLLSYWESPDVPAVSDVAKDVVKRLKSVDPGQLPSIYLGAMEASYERCKSEAERQLEAGEITEEEFNDGENVLQPFMELCQKIAQSQAGFNAPASTIAYLAEEGVKWALEGAPDRIDFLQGASYFMVRVKGAAAAKVLQGIEAAGEAAGVPERPEDEDEDESQAWGEWDLYYQYCDALRDLANKPEKGGRAKKTPAAAAAGTGGAAAGGSARGRKSSGRRISFAPGFGGEESDEDAAEQPVVENPQPTSGNGRKAPSAAAKKKGKQPAASKPGQSGRGKKAAAGTAAAMPRRRQSQRNAAEVEEEEEDEFEEEEQQVEVDIRMADEDEGDDDDGIGSDEDQDQDLLDEVDVMPTEEQLPGMGRRRHSSQQQQKQQPKGRAQLAQVALEASDSESEEESDDEPAPVARRARRR